MLVNPPGYTIGLPLPGARFVNVITAVNTGDTDLYTVPTGKQALIQQYVVYNTSAGNITWHPQFKVSGTYYRLNQDQTLSTATGSANTTSSTILSAGEIASINTTTNNGLNVHLCIIEVDAVSTPIKVGRKLGLSNGNNTIYTAVNRAYLLSLTNAGFQLNPNGGINVTFFSDGSTRNIFLNIVPSGGSPATGNRFTATTLVNANSRGTFGLCACLAPGDFINLNVDTGAASQWAAAYAIEL